MNGGVAKRDLDKADVASVIKGCKNLGRHIENVKKFGVPVVVAINHFTSDTEEETKAVTEFVRATGCEAIPCTHWADGSRGAVTLAETIVEMTDKGSADFRPLYPDEMTLVEKIETVAKEIYGADGCHYPSKGSHPVGAVAK